jgi:hypothetical protein
MKAPFIDLASNAFSRHLPQWQMSNFDEQLFHHRQFLIGNHFREQDGEGERL